MYIRKRQPTGNPDHYIWEVIDHRGRVIMTDHNRYLLEERMNIMAGFIREVAS